MLAINGRRLACAAILACGGAGVARGDEVARAVDAAVAKIGKDTTVSIAIRSVTTGEELYARDAHVARVPASTMKLATTAAALELLGPEFEHETTVHAAGQLRDGTLQGDLVVRGSGDPSIARRFQLDDAPLLADWAAELARKVRVVEGDLVADDRAFERLGFHPDWNPAEAHEWYAAEVSALNLNDNCIDVTVAPEGSGIKAVAQPATSAVALDVRATLTGARREHRLAYVREPDGRAIRIAGKVWTKAPPFEAPVAVPSPALLFANVLRDRLAEAGVVVKGRIRLAEEKDAVPAGEPLLVRRSPLLRALATCNKSSQNLYAECLLKTLGARKGAAGSWTAGANVVAGFLRGLSIPEGEVVVRDGSGLSRHGRLSANALVRVLEAVARGKNAEAFAGSLAIAGVDGTLEKRLRDLPAGATFRGKTGTMHGVSSVAGLVELEHGANGRPEVVAVAFIVNGTRGAALAREAQDEAIRAVVRARTGARPVSRTGSRRSR